MNVEYFSLDRNLFRPRAGDAQNKKYRDYDLYLTAVVTKMRSFLSEAIMCVRLENPIPIKTMVLV